MEYIIIEGSQIKSRDDFYDFAEKHVARSTHFGRNLDALYDELSGRSISFEIRDFDKMKESLSDYADKICEVIRDSGEENGKVNLIIK